MCDKILLRHKKEGNFAIYNNMDGLGGYYLSEINHTEKDKYIIKYMESKNITLVNIKKKNLTDSGYQWREESGERQDRVSGLRDTTYCV